MCFYIVHYEQNGSDRAKYGEKLLQKLSERLNMKGYSYRDLKLYRQFFSEYKKVLKISWIQLGNHRLPNLTNMASLYLQISFSTVCHTPTLCSFCL